MRKQCHIQWCSSKNNCAITVVASSNSRTSNICRVIKTFNICINIPSNVCMSITSNDVCVCPGGKPPWGRKMSHLFHILEVILMHILDVMLMHILNVPISMHILDVILLLLATPVIAVLGIPATKQQRCWRR